MKLIIAAIPEEGQSFPFGPKEGWVRDMVSQALSDENPDLEGLSGGLDVRRVDKYINLRGKLGVPLRVSCDRCLKEIVYPFNVPIKMDLSPLYHSERDRDRAQRLGEDIELTKDDLEFNFYDGPEIDLSEILREELVLALPTGYLCSEDCKGLCPDCAVNLNSGACNCADSKPIDPRWSALKHIKPAR